MDLKNIKMADKEVKDFLKHINMMEDYWNAQNISSEDKLHGMSMTFLCLLDGCDTAYLNGFKLIDKKTGTDLSIGYLHEIKNNGD